MDLMLLIPAPLTVGAINSVCLWVVLREGMEQPAAFNVTPSAPEGLGEIVHMGREMNNLQGIFGGFKLPTMLRLAAGVISLGPRARMV